MISKKEVSCLIEPHLQEGLLESEYEVRRVDARQLLTHNRIDLGFKLLYLEMLNKNTTFAYEAYKDHIRGFSLGRYNEPGNPLKDSIQKFTDCFIDILENIKSNGFNQEKSLVPVSCDGSIINGAHRTSCAILLKEEVATVNIKAESACYDYKYFYERNVSIEHLELAVSKFIEYANNIYIALVWPSAQGHDDEIDALIPNTVYKKDVKLMPNGAHNLLSQVYSNEAWLGTIEGNFRGIRGKLVECFRSDGPVRAIVFQAVEKSRVLEIKDEIRALFNIDKHSIHITDTKEEAIKLSYLLFNENGIHFFKSCAAKSVHVLSSKADSVQRFYDEELYRF